MTSAHARSKLVGLAYATAKCLVKRSSMGEGWPSFLRHWLKFPLMYQASKALEGVPVATIPELFPGKQVGLISISPESLDRQIWHVRLDEEVLIGLTVQALGARRIFEIGTFEGGTTRLLADKAGEGAEVFTLDLPEAKFAGSWTQIGAKFRGAAVEPRIKQLFGNSLEFDFSPYERSIDLVFVDAAHDYLHGLADSRTALRLVKPGGVVLWHDFNAHFPGLVHAIIEATAGLPLKRLGMHTTLGFLRTAC
jgi:SAM-dependent methyltransferase